VGIEAEIPARDAMIVNKPTMLDHMSEAGFARQNVLGRIAAKAWHLVGLRCANPYRVSSRFAWTRIVERQGQDRVRIGVFCVVD